MESEVKKLSHRRSDIERICGFSSNKFTSANLWFALIIGCIFATIFYGILIPLRQPDGNPWYIEMFFHGGPGNRSIIPYFTVFLSCWSLAILFVKTLKLKAQRKALKLDILPQDDNFVLTSATAKTILNNINCQVEDPKRFVLLDRIIRATENVKNLENVSSLAECINTQAQNDDDFLSGSYTVLKGFIWAIPVLGFIGTVLGLSEAVGGFGAVIKDGATDTERLIKELGNVTGGLSIAFETTLIALVLALIIQIIMTAVMNKEEGFLSECSDYCHNHIISKARSITAKSED